MIHGLSSRSALGPDMAPPGMASPDLAPDISDEARRMYTSFGVGIAIEWLVWRGSGVTPAAPPRILAMEPPAGRVRFPAMASRAPGPAPVAHPVKSVHGGDS